MTNLYFIFHDIMDYKHSILSKLLLQFVKCVPWVSRQARISKKGNFLSFQWFLYFWLGCFLCCQVICIVTSWRIKRQGNSTEVYFERICFSAGSHSANRCQAQMAEMSWFLSLSWQSKYTPRSLGKGDASPHSCGSNNLYFPKCFLQNIRFLSI